MKPRDLIESDRIVGPRCSDGLCGLGLRHHGPHEASIRVGADLPRRWWNIHNCFEGHNPLSCAECGSIEDAEVARLAAGGALRPDQGEPKWLRLGKAPPPRRVKGASTTVGGRWLYAFRGPPRDVHRKGRAARVG